MMAGELHLERLLGCRVMDANGRSAGRIEELRAVRHGMDLEVREYLLGPAALLERLIRSTLSLPLLRLAARGPLAPTLRRVPWELMDLADPEHPRIHCAREALPTSDSEVERGAGGSAERS